MEKYDSLISVERVPEKYNPAVVIVDNGTGKNMAMSRIKSWFGKTENILTGVPISKRITTRQDHPQAWIPTGIIYLFKADNVKKGSFYGDKIMLLETEPQININDSDDFEKAEEWLKK